MRKLRLTHGWTLRNRVSTKYQDYKESLQITCHLKNNLSMRQFDESEH